MGFTSLVTIGIPFYNEEEFLSYTITSAIQQSFRDVEIILADNGSTDGSSAIVQKFVRVDNRIRSYKHEINKGPVFNFQFVLDQANSKYFMWLGGHDEICEHYIKEAVHVLETNADVAMVYPGAVKTNKAGDEIAMLEDNYDTQGLTTSAALFKILMNFQNGFVIHGVFRTEVLKRTPIKKIYGPDMLIIALTTLEGRIARLPMIGLRRREVRIENVHEQKMRHSSQGIFKQTTNDFSRLFVELAKAIFRNSRFSTVEKISAALNTKKILAARFALTWKHIFMSIWT